RVGGGTDISRKRAVGGDFVIRGDADDIEVAVAERGFAGGEVGERLLAPGGLVVLDRLTQQFLGFCRGTASHGMRSHTREEERGDGADGGDPRFHEEPPVLLSLPYPTCEAGAYIGLRGTGRSCSLESMSPGRGEELQTRVTGLRGRGKQLELRVDVF